MKSRIRRKRHKAAQRNIGEKALRRLEQNARRRRQILGSKLRAKRSSELPEFSDSREEPNGPDDLRWNPRPRKEDGF